MSEKQINICFLYIEMILATPGAKMHQFFRKLRKRNSFSVMILLCVILAFAAVILWNLRGNNTWLLLLAGIGVVTVFSFLFSLLKRHGDTLLGVGEMLTYPFFNSYEQCRKALDQMQANTRSHNGEAEKHENPESFASGRTNTDRTEHKHFTYDNASYSQKQSADEKRTKDQQTQNRRDNTEYHREQERNTSEKRYRRTSSGNARLEEAKAFFGVDIPFTADEIKQRRNQLLKKYHPDNPDGSEEMCKKINECYALLIRYAA
ncbi:MAG: hypothetical protein IKQ27_11030 [Lachnospiraceae bacterium]|nr:hypothetical protein [Lachnospiraceae bacterium]MBR6157481.1 hypothetical protein [Lachnospiraceae bacterium]